MQANRLRTKAGLDGREAEVHHKTRESRSVVENSKEKKGLPNLQLSLGHENSYTDTERNIETSRESTTETETIHLSLSLSTASSRQEEITFN